MAWARWQEAFILLIPAASVLVWVARGDPNRKLFSASALLLLLGTILGFGFHLQESMPNDGASGEPTPSEERLRATLNRGLAEVVEAGDRAIQEAVTLLSSEPGPSLQDGLSRVRRRKHVTALAVYDSQGLPVAWVGVHRGTVPQEIRLGEALSAYGGGPLFTYLYFTAPDPRGGGTVMAAILLQTNLPAGLREGGFAARFQNQTGVPIRILPPDRVQGPSIGGLDLDDEPFLSVTRGALDPEVLWGSRVGFWLRAVALLSLLVWGLLVMGGKGLPRWMSSAGVSLVALAFILPVDGLRLGDALSSPAHFLLPVLGWPLGRLLAVLLAVAVLFALLPRAVLTGSSRLGALFAAGIVAIAFPGVDALFRMSASSSLFVLGMEGWFPYQVGLALFLTLLVYLPLAGKNRDTQTPDPRPGLQAALALGAILAAALAVAGALVARSGPGLSPWFLSLWAGPVYLGLRGSSGDPDRRMTSTWVLAALIGSSAALPSAWGVNIEARMAEAEAEMMELGAEPDPYLEYRLHRIAETADSLDRIIRLPAELLFETWSLSGQEYDPLPMWMTIWGPGDFPEDLNMGVQGPRPFVADDYLDQVRGGTEPLVRHLGFANARYLLVVPLQGRRVLSAVVPPRGSLSLASPMGPIFAALGRVGLPPSSLVPVSSESDLPPGVGLVWERYEAGWRVRSVVEFLDQDYFASQTVPLPGTLHLIARGTLALVFDLLLILLVAGVSGLVLTGQEIDPRRLARALGSFRARVTVALFAFFFLSIAIFGTLAFQTLSGAAERTASALAEKIVEDGASFYLDVQGSMELLAREVGADLLEYRNGELRDGSADELVQLGLYEGWIPEPLYRTIEQRQEIGGSIRSSLGGWQYVMAYHSLQDGDVLATPVPLELGATALGRQEVADLLGFAVVLGAALSLVLALLVGRTLSRPIETLQVASERVGAGNLEVRLPEDRRDEFGAVFGAFNRMVLRIRRARKALLRTTRRTQAIVEEAATGVIALDSSARVTLVNPRAESLLDQQLPLGEAIPKGEGDARELVNWLDLYFRDGLREANTELQLGDRRIRIRARRVSEEGPIEGAVLSLEDVTDELRSERILAWGEMAQQVAHEVKNPLTPMKLSVQHLQRAWEDRRPDFHEILGRNVEVILREIDHLAAIARSFSRFGAPQVTGQTPLEGVSVQQVSEEVLNLYRGGKGALLFTSEVPDDVPLVRAREAELREVLINLLENSRAAIPSQGRVTIEAEPDEFGVEVRVRDDGKGIDPDFLPRVFEPHFSTRSLGTGLGLAIVRRLVESWGGTVSAESRLSEGTVIRVGIPVWSSTEDHPTTEEGQGRE